MKKIMRHLLLPAVFVVTVAGCGTRGSGQGDDPPPIQVVAYRVETGNATYYDEYPAVVVALNQVDLRPEVSGYITEISFRDGQHVRKGMKLFSIDQQHYKAIYDQATANLNVGKANLLRAQQDADRYRDLAKEDAVAKQTLDHALADLEAAKMQVAAAEANVQSAETDLGYSVIWAPFNCTVGISQVKVGSAVNAGQTLLTTISSDDPMEVEAAVDEKEIPRFTELLHAKDAREDSLFLLEMPDRSLYASTGRLVLLDRAVDPQTATIKIRASFPNPANLLRPGLTCVLRVRSSTRGKSVLVPYRAVVEQMGEYFVFVIQGKEVQERRVNLGMTINGMVVVKDGLTPGEQIVLEGVQRLRDHTLVAVAPAPASHPGSGR